MCKDQETLFWIFQLPGLVLEEEDHSTLAFDGLEVDGVLGGDSGVGEMPKETLHFENLQGMGLTGPQRPSIGICCLLVSNASALRAVRDGIQGKNEKGTEKEHFSGFLLLCPTGEAPRQKSCLV